MIPKQFKYKVEENDRNYYYKTKVEAQRHKLNFHYKFVHPKNPFWKVPDVTTREERLILSHPLKDTDKDGVKNIFDCKPFNKHKQESNQGRFL